MSPTKDSPLLNYVMDGNGPPIVLIHGIAASLSDWSRLMPLLVSAGYKVVAVDTLGHGDSPKPKDPQQYTTKVAYALLEHCIDRLGIQRPFYLVGHSLGGYLSLTYALNHPNDVNGMILINPLYSLKQLTSFLDTFLPLAGVGVELLKATPQWLVNSFLSSNDSFLTKLDAETRWTYARDIKRASPYFLRIPGSAPDLTPVLPSIATPTLVMWGVDDRIEKAESFLPLVSALPRATGKAIPNCGHHPHQGKPDLVSRMMLDFFAEHPVPTTRRVTVERSLEIDPARVAERIEGFIRQKVDEYRRDGAIVAMSGGLDSSVVASLAVRALGADKVKGLILPERDSSPDSRADALVEIARLGIAHREVELTPMLTELGAYDLLPLQILGPRWIKAAIVQQQHRTQIDALGEMPFLAGLLGTRDIGPKKQIIDAGNAYSRVKHRMRMLTTYYYADLENRLVLGTTNKSESAVGFVVKWGDNAADVEPLQDLYKTQLYRLAEYLGVSRKVIEKAPSPDLIPGIVDVMALGMDYDTLDRILVGLEQGLKAPTLAGALCIPVDQVQHVQEMQRRSEHLRSLPPAAKVS